MLVLARSGLIKPDFETAKNAMLTKGILMATALSLFLPVRANTVLNTNCYSCHGEKDFPGGYVDKARYIESVHGKFSCAACHISITVFPHGISRKVNCGICHLAGMGL